MLDSYQDLRVHQPKVGLLVDKRGGPEGALGLPNSTKPFSMAAFNIHSPQNKIKNRG